MELFNSQLILKNCIEKLRYDIASQLLELMLKSENLVENLENLKNFFLMSKGEFYQVFIEESSTLLKFMPKKDSEQIINNSIVPNVQYIFIQQQITCKSLFRLNMDESQFKNFTFVLKDSGFNFPSFSDVENLSILGEVRHINKFLRFEPRRDRFQTGFIKHLFKLKQQGLFGTQLKKIQIMDLQRSLHLDLKEMDLKEQFGSNLNLNFLIFSQQLRQFQGSFAGQQGQVSQSEAVELSNSSRFTSVLNKTKLNILSLVIQNCKELNSWKKNIPTNLKDLSEYLCVKICLKEHANAGDQKSVSKSSIQVEWLEKVAKSNQFMKQQFNQNSTVLAEKEFEAEILDFSEEAIHQLSISYSVEKGNLLVVQLDQMQEIKVSFNLQRSLNLELGKGFVGFLQEGVNGNFAVDIASWILKSNHIYNNDDPWNVLSLNFEANWPLNLILSPSILEKYSNLFRYLFPIKFAIILFFLYQIEQSKLDYIINGNHYQNQIKNCQKPKKKKNKALNSNKKVFGSINS